MSDYCMSLSRRSFIAILLLSALLCAQTGPRATTRTKRYPNELPGLMFYAKYLIPLQPGVSDSNAVRQTLGDTATVNRDGWRITPRFTEEGTLFQISLRPEHVITMATVKFPAVFKHCHSSVSEFNIAFDVYSDSSGLEYWLHQADSKWGKKGDLWEIVYANPGKPDPPNTFC